MLAPITIACLPRYAMASVLSSPGLVAAYMEADGRVWRGNRFMDEAAFSNLSAWVTEAGLIGRTESELMAGFCQRVVDAGVPLARALVILDTLHPVYEGCAFLWRADAPERAEV